MVFGSKYTKNQCCGLKKLSASVFFFYFCRKPNDCVMNKNTGTILIVVLIIETLVIGWLVYDRFTQKEENQVLQTELTEATDEKQKVENELEDMLQQYEDLKTDNAEVNAKLEEEQAKIEKLMAELKTVKRGDRYKIEQLEKETETLKRIMKGYIRQIDSLNTMNQELTAENIKVKERYETVVEESKELETVRDSLKTQVKQASGLKTYGVSPLPLNRWGRDTQRAGWVKRIKVCFHVAENDLAYTGNRSFYIRIADPTGKILTNSQSTLFEYKGKNIAYSVKRDFNYTGADTEICMFWDGEEQELPKGNYTVDIYSDGRIIGNSTFSLK